MRRLWCPSQDRSQGRSPDPCQGCPRTGSKTGPRSPLTHNPHSNPETGPQPSPCGSPPKSGLQDQSQNRPEAQFCHWPIRPRGGGGAFARLLVSHPVSRSAFWGGGKMWKVQPKSIGSLMAQNELAAKQKRVAGQIFGPLFGSGQPPR